MRIEADQPCSAFDLALEIGVEVRLAPLPSAEDIDFPGKPVIIVSSLRPSGRQAFTCAHEIGHHVYGHGEQFDELVEERGTNRKYDPKEFEGSHGSILRGIVGDWQGKTLVVLPSLFTATPW